MMRNFKTPGTPFGISAFTVAWVLGGCSPSYRTSNQHQAASEPASNPALEDKQASAGLIGARIQFHVNDFFSLSSPRTETGCAGDAKTYYHPWKVTAARAPAALPQSKMDPNQSVIPPFIKNVSVDLTSASAPVSTNKSSACSLGAAPTAPPPSNCASFDDGSLSELSSSSGIVVPGYSSQYYTFLDHACTKAGPISIWDPAVNKILAGGVYFDIDRSELGANENLLLHLTFFPLGPANWKPDASSIPPSESAQFKVHLIRTGQTTGNLRLTFQPRYMAYSDTAGFPEVARSIAILAPPTGQPRQEQIVIPISIDPAIDRIRIERYSGSGILIDAALFRTGSS